MLYNIVYALLQAVKGHRLEALWTVAVAIGVRRAAALEGTDKDMDGPESSPTVRGGLYRLNGKL